MQTVTHKGISVNSNNISGKSSKPLEKDTKFECLQLTPLLLQDIAEHGVSSAKPFNAYNYARNVPRSTTASLEILPPAHTHTHTHTALLETLLTCAASL